MFFFFFKQKTAYEMRISDWSSDVCSSDLLAAQQRIGCGLVDLAALHQDRLGLVDDRAFGEGVFRLVEFALEPRKGLEAADGKVDTRFDPLFRQAIAAVGRHPRVDQRSRRERTRVAWGKRESIREDKG